MQAKKSTSLHVKLFSMRKSFAVLIISFVVANTLIAQPGQLMIKGYGKDLHLDHTVAAKEGIFAIGRLYNVHPKTIAAYNNIDMAKGLSLGQVIHIPLTDTNFSQKTNKGTPVYYKTADKETLLKVSTVNNRVSMQSLRDWNKLANDNLSAGKKLIIGFLISNASPAVTIAAPAKEELKKPTEEKPQVKTNTDKPVAKTEEVIEKPVVKKEEPKKEEPKKEEPKKAEPVVTVSQVTNDIMSGQGYFKSFFDQQTRSTPVSKTETVTSGIFKMLSGPQEAKYYLLMDGIPSGTLVRIINPENNKTVYAKVLGEMGGVRQNQGLNIRISNATASTLGIADTDKFIVKINY
jgi:murein DD-endopeptidase MepM/ murein hydrolase activator NlpD